MTTITTGVTPPAEAPTGTPRRDAVTAIVAKIMTAQSKARQSKTDLITAFIEIGNELEKLQEAAGKRWKLERDNLGYDERTAQRLIQLAKGPLQDVIRTNGTEFSGRLPTELQKLCTISRLSSERIKQGIDGGWDCESMTRQQLSDAVNAMVTADEIKTGSIRPNVTKGRAKSGSTGSKRDRVDEQTADSRLSSEPDTRAIESKQSKTLAHRRVDRNSSSAIKRLRDLCEQVDGELAESVQLEAQEAGGDRDEIKRTIVAAAAARSTLIKMIESLTFVAY